MKTRIFVADDHAMVRRGLAAVIAVESDLELCGEAEDCATATSEVARLRPDVVIADISLRGNSGIELIKNIKAFDPGIHIVVFSVHDKSVYALRVLKAGAKAYVTKQEVASKVIDAIRKVRSGQMYVSERVSGQMLNRLVKSQDEVSDSPVAGLSDRELEVVSLIGSGLATREIAARLHMSVKTVETHRAYQDQGQHGQRQPARAVLRPLGRRMQAAGKFGRSPGKIRASRPGGTAAQKEGSGNPLAAARGFLCVAPRDSLMAGQSLRC